MRSLPLLPARKRGALSTQILQEIKLTISDIASVVHAWQAIASHHDALRYVRDGDHIFVSSDVPQITLGRDNDGDMQTSILNISEEQGALIACIRSDYCLLDITSIRLIQDDFVRYFQRQALRMTLPVEEVVTRMSSTSVAMSEIYWRETQADASTARLHVFGETNTSMAYASESLSLPQHLKDRMEQFGAIAGIRFRSILLGAWALVIKTHSEASEAKGITFATAQRNQSIAGIEAQVGPFDQFYPVHVPVDGNQAVVSWLSSLQHADTEGSHYANLGLQRINELSGQLPSTMVTLEMEHASCPIPHDEYYPSLVLNYQSAAGNAAGGTLALQYEHTHTSREALVILEHVLQAADDLCSQVLLAECNIVSRTERLRLLELGRPLTGQAQGLIHNLFEAQVLKTPDRPALQFEFDEPITYRQLNELANGVARQLPCERGSLVPVSMSSSVGLVVSMIAVLKKGAAYVPVDPSVPKARNEYIYKDVAATFALVSRASAGVYPRELVIDDLMDKAIDHETTNLDVEQAVTDLCYVVYTSGSTGLPKGVLLEHQAAYTGLDAFPYLEDLRQLLFHNPVFSAAQRSVWSTLKQGGCLCVARRQNLTTEIATTINTMRINVIDVTPSTAQFLTPGTVPTLKRLTVAGELINPALVPLWIDEVELLNAFGLSECTQFNWRHPMRRGQNPQNIGRPVDSTSAYVLVPGSTQLSPLMVPGELCLGGHQLARGYLNRPEKTAEAFIQNPFGPGRLYRTGDLVITHADEEGSIEILGRIDFSTKINDQRVSPGEPNSLIQQYRGVHDSAVVAATISGRSSLVAVVVPQTAMPLETMSLELRQHLEQLLPGYMVPSYFLFRDELPTNINGKTDIGVLRKLVEDLGWEGLTRRSEQLKASIPSDDHTTAAATIIQTVFSSVLKVPQDRIHPDDTFVSIGGTSLDAMRVTSAAKKQGMHIEIMDLLSNKTIRELATTITMRSRTPPAAEQRKSSAIDPKGETRVQARTILQQNAEIEDVLPATPFQEGILQEELATRGSYMLRKAFSMSSHTPSQILTALNLVVAAQPIWRTTFTRNGERFFQVVHRDRVHIPHRHHSATSLGSLLRERQDTSSSAGEEDEGFGARPLVLLDTTSEHFVIRIHHTLCDHWSINFFYRDLHAALQKLQIPHRAHFSKYVRYIEGKDTAEADKFWERSLKGATRTWLDPELKQPSHIVAQVPFNLQQAAATAKSTVGALLYTAWAIVLHRWTGSLDVVFNVTVAGRHVPVEDILSVVGPTMSIVPMVIRLRQDQALSELIQDVNQSFWELTDFAWVGMRSALVHGHAKSGLGNTGVNVLLQPPEDHEKDDSTPTLQPLQIEGDFDATEMLQIDLIQSKGGEFCVRAQSNNTFTHTNEMIRDVLAIFSMVRESPDLTVSVALDRMPARRAIEEPMAERETQSSKNSPELDWQLVQAASSGINTPLTDYDTDSPQIGIDDQPSPHSVEEPTILGSPSEEPTIPRKTALLSIPRIPRTSTVLLHANAIALWATAWSVLLSRHTGQKKPLFAIASRDGQGLSVGEMSPELTDDKSLGVLLTGVNSLLRDNEGTAISLSEAVGRDAYNTMLSFERDVWKRSPVQESSLVVVTVEESRFETALSLSAPFTDIQSDFILWQLSTIAQAIAYQSHLLLSQVEILGQREQAYLTDLAKCQSTPAGLLHTSFELCAQQTPEKVALQWETTISVTYHELNKRANQLARYLRGRGARFGQYIALYLDKSIDTIIAILAVLKSGAAFVPLSPDNPNERNLVILGQARCFFLLTEAKYQDFATSAGVEPIYVDSTVIPIIDDSDPQDVVEPGDPAYVIFTSGSTGTPKGVRVSHRAIAAAIKSIGDFEGYDDTWRCLFTFNYVFDASLHNIFPVLSAGGTLCLASSDRLVSELAAVINEMGIRQLNLSPTSARQLRPEDVPSVESLTCGGEQLTSDIIQRWASSHRLINCYGPTEASVITTMKVVTPHSSSNSLGRPLKTISAIIMEVGGQRLTPFGSVGELCLAGDHLADGYIGRDDLTKDAFMIWSDGTRVYRTGDKARWTETGELQYFGRIDKQTKINGFRIELGEIEQVIMQSGVVQDCAVLVLDNSARPRLAAFCVFKRGIAKFGQLANYAREVQSLQGSFKHLAHYMVPHLIFPMGRLPQQASSKTDRKRLKHMAESLSQMSLRDFAISSLNTRQQDVPTTSQTSEEVFLREAWATLFGVPAQTIGQSTTFFELGGDSIAAINLVDAARDADWKLSVSDVLESATLSKVAGKMRHKQRRSLSASAESFQVPEALKTSMTARGIQSEDVEYVYPCPAGQTQWLKEGAQPEQHWVVTTTRAIPAHHDVQAYLDLLRAFTAKNEILRTTFVHTAGHGWHGVVFRAPVLDVQFRAISRANRTAAIKEIEASRFEFCKPFVRYVFLQYPDGTDLVLKAHHAVWDGTSLRIADEDIIGIQDGKNISNTPWKSFVVSEARSDKRKSLEWWQQQHRERRPSVWPPAVKPLVNRTFRHEITIAQKTALEQLASSCGVTPATVFQSLYQVALTHHAPGPNEMAASFDYLLTGRNVDVSQPQTVNGPCANFLSFITAPVTRDDTVGKYLLATQNFFWAATEHGNVGLSDLDAAQNTSLFVFQPFEKPTGPPKSQMRWLVMGLADTKSMAQPYALMEEVAKTADSFALIMAFDDRVVSEAIVRGFVEWQMGTLSRWTRGGAEGLVFDDA